ncbi:MAG: transaldolase family protein [archaeon]
MNNTDYIKNYLEESQEVLKHIDAEECSKFIEILFNAWKRGKKVITAGNGGSSATASHFAGDLLKTVVNDSSMKEISKNRGFKAICLNDNSAALTAWVNDSGWDKAYSGLLNTLIDEGDVLMLISVHGGSGWSGNVVEAMKLAKMRNAKIIGLAGFDGGKMKEMSDACIVIPKDSTPHVEGLHGVIQHLVVFRLKELIAKHKMKFFADTANHEEIDFCFQNNVADGITTNPKIMETTGDLSKGFEFACKEIVDKYPGVPISLETDVGGIKAKELSARKDEVKDILVLQAEKLASLSKDVVIKIPICEAGLMAVKELSEKCIRTNVTACMTPYQALKAAEAGATYVSLFANRALDSHILSLAGVPLRDIIENPDWKVILKEKKNQYFEEAWERTVAQIAYTASELDDKYPNTELIVGSIRSPEDIHRILKARPHIVTIPTKIVKGLLEQGSDMAQLKEQPRQIKSGSVLVGNSLMHPMTDYTLDEFEEAAMAYRK